MKVKRAFLLGVVASFALAALLGIWVLVFESFFNIEEEVFSTLGSVVLFCLPALAASAMLEKRHWPVVMIFDVVLCLAGLVFYLMVIWDIGPWTYWSNYWLSDTTWKIMLLAAIWAVAFPWAALLGRTAFRNWYHWIRLVSIVVVLATAAAISVAVVFEIDEDPVLKLLGVLGILTALGTISLPILYKVHGIDRVAQIESTPLELKITCPRCLLEQTVTSGYSRCRRCRLKFRIEIEEPRCPKCNYLLYQLTAPRCPECGQALAPDEMQQLTTPSPP
ncbi:MAG: zinc ribbon domain-containing protein [Phycisphaeraceae bacterium]